MNIVNIDQFRIVFRCFQSCIATYSIKASNTYTQSSLINIMQCSSESFKLLSFTMKLIEAYTTEFPPSMKENARKTFDPRESGYYVELFRCNAIKLVIHKVHYSK